MMDEELRDFFNLTLFQGIDPEKRALLEPTFQMRYEPAGTLLFQQGDPAEYLYILLEGAVCIRFKPEDGPAIIITHVQPKGIVGWSAALGNLTYTASAVCSMDCKLLRVSGQDLRTLCKQHPEVGTVLLERLANMISQRLSDTHHMVVSLLEQGFRLNGYKPIMVG